MKRVLALIATASVFCMAGAAQAAEPSTDKSSTVDEVVVTSEKVSQSIQKAPISVTVVDQQKLTDMGAVNFVDYASTIPALSFESLAPGEQRILIRGVSDGVDTGLRGQTQNVTGVYIDDMVVSNNYTSPDLNLYDVARVEVLKGPQGTLYGDGSVGGLVRIITNKAKTNDFEADIEATAGTIHEGGGEYALNGMVNLPLVQDKLALRLVGQWADNDGFIDDVVRNINDVNWMHQWGGRASLLWTPTANFSLTLNALTQHTKLGGRNDYNIFLGDLKRGTIFGEGKDTTFDLYNATADWQLGWATLTSSTSYSKFDRLDAGDFTDFLSTIFPVILPSHSQQGQHSKTFSEEVRLASRPDQPFRWLAGAYYSHFKENGFETDVSDGLFDFFNAIGMPLQGTIFDVGHDVIFGGQDFHERTQWAAFGEANYDLTHTLTATVGGRWFSDDLTDRDDAGGVVTSSEPFSLTKSTKDNGWVFRFRLSDQVNDNVLLYALASEGYRTGGLNPLNPGTINDPTFPPAFEPDSLWNYEFGWKTRWLDNRLTINGAAYYIDWNNIQIETPLPTGFSVIANAGSAKIKGIEIDTSLRPVGGLELGASGSLIDAELGQDTPGLGNKGDQLTGVPKVQGMLYAQWRFPISASIDGFLRGDLRYVGKTDRFFGSDVDAYGDYTLVNLRGGIRRGNLDVTLFVENVGDKRAAFFRGSQSTASPLGREDVYVAQPRTIGVTVAHHF